jgi:hypothetical protein
MHLSEKKQKFKYHPPQHSGSFLSLSDLKICITFSWCMEKARKESFSGTESRFGVKASFQRETGSACNDFAEVSEFQLNLILPILVF